MLPRARPSRQRTETDPAAAALAARVVEASGAVAGAPMHRLPMRRLPKVVTDQPIRDSRTSAFSRMAITKSTVSWLRAQVQSTTRALIRLLLSTEVSAREYKRKREITSAWVAPVDLVAEDLAGPTGALVIRSPFRMAVTSRRPKSAVVPLAEASVAAVVAGAAVAVLAVEAAAAEAAAAEAGRIAISNSETESIADAAINFRETPTTRLATRF